MENEIDKNDLLKGLTDEEFNAILKFSELPPEKKKQVLGAIEELSQKR